VVDDQIAAAVMMQGLTAYHLVTETYPVAAGDTAVVVAAAGGVGLPLTQMVKAAGGRAIGLVSREDKAPAAHTPPGREDAASVAHCGRRGDRLPRGT